MRPRQGFEYSVPKPRYNAGSMWCAHQEIQGITHKETRGCKNYNKRTEKRMQPRICKTCVFAGDLIGGRE